LEELHILKILVTDYSEKVMSENYWQRYLGEKIFW